MSVLVTVVLVLVIVGALVLIVLGPIRAVREDRRLAEEERGWLDAGRFPARLERVYNNPRMMVTDAPRLRALGYEEVGRRRARGDWGRVLVVTWRAAAPPSGTREVPAESS
jgi:hypothetical protein